jgi:hypothetical protein
MVSPVAFLFPEAGIFHLLYWYNSRSRRSNPVNKVNAVNEVQKTAGVIDKVDLIDKVDQGRQSLGCQSGQCSR